MHSRCDLGSTIKCSIKSNIMENLNKVQNLRKINISFISATDLHGAKVKISESPRYKSEKTSSKTFSFDYSFGCIEKQGYDVLSRNGWNIIARCSVLNSYSFLCDNWGYTDNEKHIKDLK